MIYYKIYYKPNPKYFFIGTTQNVKKEVNILEKNFKSGSNNLYKFIIENGGLINFTFETLFKLPNHENNQLEKKCFLKLLKPTILK